MGTLQPIVQEFDLMALRKELHLRGGKKLLAAVQTGVILTAFDTDGFEVGLDVLLDKGDLFFENLLLKI